MPEISLIIPVYNCMPYLETCIQSIQKQDTDLEIICIDDGSVDGSLELLKKMSEKDKRIRWYHQDHVGAATARNFGIHVASGEYIAFMDADDFYLDDYGLKKMIKKCRDYDVDACGSVMSLLQNKTIRLSANHEAIENMARQGILQYNDFQMDYDFTTFVFKKSIVTDNYIYFPQYGYYEDPPFLVRVLFAAQEFAMSDVRLYCYRIRHGNILSVDQCNAVLDGVKENLLFASQNGLNMLFEKTLSRLEYEYGDIILNNINTENLEIFEKLTGINKIVCDHLGKYMIRPLKKIFIRNQLFGENYEQYLKNRVDKSLSVYIYGAGSISRKFEKYLSGLGVRDKIKGFIVSNMAQNHAEEVSGIRIYGFRNVLKSLDRSYILVAVGSVHVAEIVQMLELNHVKNYEVIDAVFLESI